MEKTAMEYIKNITETFKGWQSLIANIQRRLYYRDQSPTSFKSLYDLAHNFSPDIIVECGTMSGMSLRCWLAATHQARVKCIDLNFSPLQKSMEILPLDLSRVDLIQADLRTADFSSLWHENDRVLFFVDAHDVPPDISIMSHVLKNAVPHLPEGSLFVVDDVWHSQDAITQENVKTLYNSQILPEIDELQPFESHYAPYHGGGSFWGFAEIAPLLHYVNAHAIPLQITPGAKHVFFYNQKQKTTRPLDSVEFNKACGKFCYHPLDNAVSGGPVTERCMQGVTKLYNKGDYAAALNLLIDLQNNVPDAVGISYAIAIILARSGEFGMAAEFLKTDMALPTANSKSEKFYADIRSTFLRHRDSGKHRKPGVTIFAVPKAFKGHNNIIQRNAIRSWLNLSTKPTVMLMGNDAGTAEICEEFGLLHVPDLCCNDFGTPKLDDIFFKAQETANTEVICYSNADILIFDDLMRAIDIASQKFENFLLVGARLDYDITEELDFSQPDAIASVFDAALKNGVMHAPTGMDYFAFKPGLWPHIPPFALGRIAWDSWLLHDALRQNMPVIDCTGFFIPVHQNHGYSHVHSGLGAKGLYGNTDPEAKCNRQLAAPLTYGDNVNAAQFFLHKSGTIIKRAGK